jgi:hypothetical protein
MIDLLKFVLLNGTLGTVTLLLDGIAKIAQLTADVNVIPRFKTLNRSARVEGAAIGLSDKPSDEIDIQDCLQLLVLSASLCAKDPALSKSFWDSIRVDFISMLLRKSQQVEDVIMTIKLLHPCVQNDQLGAIRSPDATAGQTSEQHIIDRLTSMLIEVPRPLEGAMPYDPLEIVEMRLEILDLVEQLCDTKLGGHAFAMHPHALGRVTRAMNDEFTAIYVNLTGHKQRSEVVNHACRIVFYVTTTYGDEINLQEKLRSQPGGVNKYLIALSRLVFSDAIFYERYIDEDVFDCAHQMLEDFVTPEEGDALKAAFVKEDR